MTAKAIIKKALLKTGFDIKRVGNSLSYDEAHKRESFNILKEIESNGHHLSQRNANLCDEYATEILGSPVYAPWLYVYTALSGEFKEGWIPDNYYGFYVVPRRNGSYGKTSYQKAFSRLLFRTAYFPDVGYYVNGRFFDAHRNFIKDKDLKKILFDDGDVVVFKEENSSRGFGIHFFKKSAFSADKIRNLGNGVFQKRIRQHALFDNFSGGGVATLRITTVIDEKGRASVRSGYLRIGRNDDSHVKSSSHIRVPIDIKTGKFGSIGYLPNWREIEEHPDTLLRFENFTFPSFKECKNLSETLHSEMPFAQCIGWDLAIDEAGDVNVLEWNGKHNDIKFSEAIQGPCFADLNWRNIWREG